LHALITTLLSQARSSQTPLTLVPLIGLAVDVMIRLKNVKDTHLSADLKVWLPACTQVRFDSDVENSGAATHVGVFLFLIFHRNQL